MMLNHSRGSGSGSCLPGWHTSRSRLAFSLEGVHVMVQGYAGVYQPTFDAIQMQSLTSENAGMWFYGMQVAKQ